MYRYIVALLLCLLCYNSKGQQTYNTQGKPTSLTIINGQLTAPRLKAPTSFSSSAPYFSDTGNIAVVGGVFYFYNGSSWVNVASGSGADSSIFTTIHRDDTGKRNIRTSYLSLSGGNMNGPVDVQGYSLTGLTTPVNETDAVPYGFFQQFMTGLAWKTLVLATTTEELPAFTFDGVDQIVFNDMGDCPVIDGVTLPLNARLLNKNSTGADTAYNGIYTVSQLGDEETQCVFQRSTDANTALLLNRATVAADSGVINRSKIFSQVNTITTINVTPVTFVPILDAVVNAGYGLTKVGNTLNVDTAIVMQVHDSLTGTGILAKKYLTPYWFFNYMNGGVEWYGQWAWLDGSSNQRAILDPSTGMLSLFNALGSTASDFRPDGFNLNQPLGNGQFRARTLSGTWTWYLQNKSYTLADSADVAAKQDEITLTTTGTSGPATFDGTTLNIPEYAGGITTLNTLTATTQTFATGTSGTDFAISSATSTHTFNLPTASATNTGKLSNTDWAAFNNKQATSDTNTYDATKAWVLTQGYATNGSLLGVTIYSVAGTYTVTVPVGTTRIMYRAYGGGGGAAACLGNTSALSVSGGGCKGTKAEGYYDSWTTVVAVVGAGGSAGAISGCPGACAASNGGTGGTTTITNGTNTTTCPGGVGSLTYTPANANRAIKGGSATGVVATGANIVNGYSEFGHYGVQIANIVPNTMSGYGSAWAEIGQGGEGITTSNTAGNSGVGNASGGGGCISNTATGAANSKDGGAGAPGYVILFFYK